MNHATEWGGAAYWQAHYADFSNVVIQNNSAGDFGGGLAASASFAYSDEVWITSCSITDNTAPTGSQIALLNTPEKYPAEPITIRWSVIEGGSSGVYRESDWILNWVADLTGVTVTFGTLMSGGLQDLIESDDSRLRTRSIPGFTAKEANLMELRVGAETPVQSASSLDLRLEGRLNQPGGTVRVRLRDWNSNAFIQVHQYPIGFTETVETIEGIDATNRVRASDGRIQLSLRHSVFATFSVLGFDSFTDQVEIVVR
jgi:hypothetical protein